MATTSSISRLGLSAECNLYYHTNSFTAEVLLNQNRSDLTNGAWVYMRYGYNRAGTSTWNITGWYPLGWVSNNRGTGHTSMGEPFTMSGPSFSNPVSFNVTSGQIYGWAQAAVLNQATRQYEYTQTYADYYREYGQYNIAGGSPSACWVSL